MHYSHFFRPSACFPFFQLIKYMFSCCSWMHDLLDVTLVSDDGFLNTHIPWNHPFRCLDLMRHLFQIATVLIFTVTISCTIPITDYRCYSRQKQQANCPLCGDTRRAQPIGSQECDNGRSYWLRAQITLTDSQPHVLKELKQLCFMTMTKYHSRPRRKKAAMFFFVNFLNCWNKNKYHVF